MDWLTFQNVTSALIALFTGITGLVSWKIYRDQRNQRLPAVFLRCKRYDNACKLRITVRNRADHPLRVTAISVVNFGRIGLAQHIGGLDGTRGKERVYETYGKVPAKRSMEVEMTLTSSGRDGDSGYREFILSATNPPARIEIEVSIDPSDGSDETIAVRRAYKFTEDERRIIGLTKLHPQ